MSSHRSGADAWRSRSPASARNFATSTTDSMLARVADSSFSSEGTSTSVEGTRAPPPGGPSAVVEPGEEALRGHPPIGVADDLRDLVPVGVTVDADPAPAAVADVRRTEVAVRVGGEQFLLGTGRRRAPEGE